MRISLIDQNGKYPDNANMALRKIKTHFKERGHTVGFNLLNPNVVYISRIFKNDNLPLPLECVGAEEIHMGGGGWDVKTILPPEIEHTCPDYEGLDFSMGRTSWGCPRCCPFCMTWKMEGRVTIEHSPFEEFVRHDKVLLYDANIFSSPKCIEKLERIAEEKWKVSFNQGLDIRLLTQEICQLLNEIKTRDKDFRDNIIYFAWDLKQYDKQVMKGIETALNNGIRPRRMMFYVLVGYDSTLEYDIFRCNKLIENRIDPFVMVYNNRRDIPEIRHLARYMNKKFFRGKKGQSVEDYIAEQMRGD